MAHGKMTCRLDRACVRTPMATCTLESGSTVNRSESVRCNMQMVMCTREAGSSDRGLATGSSSTHLGPSSMEPGKQTAGSRAHTTARRGLYMTENSQQGNHMARASAPTWTTACMKVCGRTADEREPTDTWSIQQERNTQECGTTTNGKDLAVPFANGDKYEGGWSNDMRNGEG